MLGFSSSDRRGQEELLCLHRGQGLEILWRDSLQCPTEEEYVRMVNFSAFRPLSMYAAYTSTLR